METAESKRNNDHVEEFRIGDIVTITPYGPLSDLMKRTFPETSWHSSHEISIELARQRSVKFKIIGMYNTRYHLKPVQRNIDLNAELYYEVVDLIKF